MFTLMLHSEHLDTTIQYSVMTHNIEFNRKAVSGEFQTRISLADDEPEENVPHIIKCITEFTRNLHVHFSQPN